MAEKPANAPQKKLVEPVVAVLMALTTLCTAWCSYGSAARARRSNGLMNESNALEQRAALVADIVVKAINGLDLNYPTVSPEARKALVAARKELEGDSEKSKIRKRNRLRGKQSKPTLTPITRSLIVPVPVETNELLHQSSTTNL